MKLLRPDKEGSKRELLGGHFSQRLGKHENKIIPCEGEALAARCLIQHNSSFLRENKKNSNVFSDNLPICQAWKKMKTGIWSKSSKIASLLTVMSIYNLVFFHLPGVKQKYVDDNSRHPPACSLPKCQICRFVFKQVEIDIPNLFITPISTVDYPGEPNSLRNVTAEQIEQGEVKIPFTENAAWF